jgi:hypothetical protein
MAKGQFAQFAGSLLSILFTADFLQPRIEKGARKVLIERHAEAHAHGVRPAMGRVEKGQARRTLPDFRVV